MGYDLTMAQMTLLRLSENLASVCGSGPDGEPREGGVGQGLIMSHKDCPLNEE